MANFDPKKPDLVWRLTMIWPHGFISIAEGLVLVLSAGFITPKWTLDFAFWRSRLRNRRQRRKDSNDLGK